MPPVENIIGAACVSALTLFIGASSALTPMGAAAIRIAGGLLAVTILAATYFR